MKRTCATLTSIPLFPSRYIDDVYAGDYKKMLAMEESGELDKFLRYSEWEGKNGRNEEE
jgi:hypothetical protein